VNFTQHSRTTTTTTQNMPKLTPLQQQLHSNVKTWIHTVYNTAHTQQQVNSQWVFTVKSGQAHSCGAEALSHAFAKSRAADTGLTNQTRLLTLLAI
jgi:hypothetical protein